MIDLLDLHVREHKLISVMDIMIQIVKKSHLSHM